MKEGDVLLNNYECSGQMSIFDYPDFLPDKKEETISINDLIEEAVLRGTGFDEGKQRVCELYLSDLTPSERANRIKEEYGQGGAGWPLDGNGLHGYNTYRNGLTIEYRDDSGNHEKKISWKEVEKVIHKLIDEGRYCKKPIPYYPKMNSCKFGKCPRCGARLPEFSKPSICEECSQELDWFHWGINYLTTKPEGDTPCETCAYADWNKHECKCEYDCIRYSKYEEKQMKRNCAATLEPCNHEEHRKVAIECLGIDCKAECCQSCTESCGARCNYSAHQPKVFDKDNKQWIDNPH